MREGRHTPSSFEKFFKGCVSVSYELPRNITFIQYVWPVASKYYTIILYSVILFMNNKLTYVNYIFILFFYIRSGMTWPQGSTEWFFYNTYVLLYNLIRLGSLFLTYRVGRSRFPIVIIYLIPFQLYLVFDRVASWLLCCALSIFRTSYVLSNIADIICAPTIHKYTIPFDHIATTTRSFTLIMV